jgi:hypothetical protein
MAVKILLILLPEIYEENHPFPISLTSLPKEESIKKKKTKKKQTKK